ncbi:MAG: glycine cleavage system protein H [Alphaproteobacteria bacterium]|nr:glycine cleavage system protein H [Alphaproteobacteria bacterium]
MAIVLGCNLPDDLLYDVENNMWYRENGDGTLTVGMTAVAMGMAGSLVAVTPKKVGRKVKPGRSCATIESGKWVGPAKLASGGEVLEINEALVASPSMANDDPYTSGWLMKVQPEEWDSIKPQLITGDGITAAFEAKMQADEFVGCEAAAA